MTPSTRSHQWEPEELLRLAERVEKTVPDVGASLVLVGLEDEVKQAVWKLFHIAPRQFLHSIDAAMTLVPEGWYWRAGHGVLWPGWAHLNRKHPDHCEREDEHSAHAETPALALCAAALRARASTPPEGHNG